MARNSPQSIDPGGGDSEYSRSRLPAAQAPGSADVRSDARPEGGDRDDPAKRAAAERFSADEAHDLQVIVWDVPPTIETGARFALKVGLKCSAACRPEGWALKLRDHDGNARATASPGDEPWPGTAALHYAEVTLEAPEEAGLYRWQAVVDAADGVDAAATADAAVPHVPVAAEFGVRVVARPDCFLTVRAVDRESRKPVEGVRVVAHPYRAVTDAHGVARLGVPKGDYRLFVSGRGYLPFRHEATIAQDVTIKAELDLDIEPSDAEIWS